MKLFIRTRAGNLRPGETVRAKGLTGRMGNWQVESVGRKETVLSNRRGTMRVTPRCQVLRPITADPHLC
jgi:hypothetical protein